MSAQKQPPNGGARGPSTPPGPTASRGHSIQTTKSDGGIFARWTATETSSGKTVSAPFESASILVLILLLALLGDEIDDADDLWDTPTAERPEVALSQTDDGWWVARNTQLGVTTQGRTRRQALDNLDEAERGAEAARASDSAAPEPDAPWFESA